MRKLTALVLALCLVLSLCSFASAEEATYNMPEMNTTDEFTLTFMTWDDFEMAEALAASFMELYPNITVEIIRTTTGDVAGDITNMAANNSMPDVYYWLDLTTLLGGNLMYDITEYIENDEEAQTMLYPTLRRMGYVDGKRCYFMSGEMLLGTVYLDANIFETLNVELPPQDWTWDDFVELTQTMTDPSQNIWAYFNGMYAPVTFGPISLTPNAVGEFGWNGTEYNFEAGWVEAVELQIENARLGNTLDMNSDAYIALHPDLEWGGQTGHVAIVTDASWTLNNLYTSDMAIGRGIKMVPYNPPIGAENGGQLAFLDCVSVSAQTEHPREAYELMKYMCWGKDGWLKRCELFPTITWEGTDTVAYTVPNCFPMVEDDEVRAAYAALLPDLGYWNDWDAFLSNIKNPVTWGSRVIPGFQTFVDFDYHGSDYNGVTGIENAIREGVVDPNDYVDILAQMGMDRYNEAMAVFYSIYGYAE